MPWNRQEEKQFDRENKTTVNNGTKRLAGIEKFQCDEYFFFVIFGLCSRSAIILKDFNSGVL